MYLPNHFAESRTDALHGLIQRNPLATLIVQASGGLSVDHVPLTLRTDAARARLLGHVARANPLWQRIAAGTTCVAVFHGRQHYVSPNGYASKARTGEVVPTWNYEVVHVHGSIRPVDDRAWLRELLEALTAENERSQVHPWKVDDAPVEYIERMLGAVVGLEIEIVDIAGKAKLSQNQPLENRRSLVDALRAAGGDHANDMADAIESAGAAGHLG